MTEFKLNNTNLLLAEWEYWTAVVAARTERSEVRKKTTEGQYTPERLELAWLVRSLLYGTRAMLVLNLPPFEDKNTQIMTVSTETVRIAKSRPRKNQSERSDLPCHIIIVRNSQDVFQGQLNVRRLKVALQPLHRISHDFAKSSILSCLITIR